MSKQNLDKSLLKRILEVVKGALHSMDEATRADVYALSFYVDENNEGGDIVEYLPRLELHCNTNQFLNGQIAEIEDHEVSDDWSINKCISERKWNFAYWGQNTLVSITPADEAYKEFAEYYFTLPISGAALTEGQIESRTDECWKYFNAILVKVARTLHADGTIEKLFGRPIPIAIHALEYSYEHMYMTAAANPYGQAEEWMAFNFHDPATPIA